MVFEARDRDRRGDFVPFMFDTENKGEMGTALSNFLRTLRAKGEDERYSLSIVMLAARYALTEKSKSEIFEDIVKDVRRFFETMEGCVLDEDACQEFEEGALLIIEAVNSGLCTQLINEGIDLESGLAEKKDEIFGEMGELSRWVEIGADYAIDYMFELIKHGQDYALPAAA